MMADPEGPSFISCTVERHRYSDDADVTHGTKRHCGGLTFGTAGNRRNNRPGLKNEEAGCKQQRLTHICRRSGAMVPVRQWESAAHARSPGILIPSLDEEVE